MGQYIDAGAAKSEATEGAVVSGQKYGPTSRCLGRSTRTLLLKHFPALHKPRRDWHFHERSSCLLEVGLAAFKLTIIGQVDYSAHPIIHKDEECR
jgi:hypothetical protein